MLKLMHIGHSCPKGTTELSGAIHLGKGKWMLMCRIDDKKLALKHLFKKSKSSKNTGERK